MAEIISAVVSLPNVQIIEHPCMRIPRKRTKQPLNSSLASKRKSPIQNTGCVKFENSRATQIQYPSVVSADDTRGAQRVCKIYTAFQLKMEVAAAAFIPTSPSLRNSSKIDTGEMGPRQHEQEQALLAGKEGGRSLQVGESASLSPKANFMGKGEV